MRTHWDIFCMVVDNYGDIGIAWRLARGLAGEHGLAVRLWVDDLSSLRQLCPEIQVSVEQQVQRGVLVRPWVRPFPDVEIADVVTAGFDNEVDHGGLRRGDDRRFSQVAVGVLSKCDVVAKVLPLKGEAAVRPVGEDRNDAAVTTPSDRFAISSPFRGRTERPTPADSHTG